MYRIQKLIYTFLVLILVISLFSGCINDKDSIIYDGRNRTYKIYIPSSYDPSNSYPLVVVFHDGGGNSVSIERVTGFSKLADEEGFIVVYPDGTGKVTSSQA